MQLHELNDMIAAICPIEGINSNGVIWFLPEATEEQRVMAQTIMDDNLNNLSDQT